MSGMCGNCDCTDKSQCVKKGNQDIIQTETSYVDAMVMNNGENDGNCKCGSSCSCTNCTCGSCH